MSGSRWLSTTSVGAMATTSCWKSWIWLVVPASLPGCMELSLRVSSIEAHRLAIIREVSYSYLFFDHIFFPSSPPSPLPPSFPSLLPPLSLHSHLPPSSSPSMLVSSWVHAAEASKACQLHRSISQCPTESQVWKHGIMETQCMELGLALCIHEYMYFYGHVSACLSDFLFAHLSVRLFVSQDGSSRVSATDSRAGVQVLSWPCSRAGLPVFVPVHHHCLQLLLLNLPRAYQESCPVRWCVIVSSSMVSVLH